MTTTTILPSIDLLNYASTATVRTARSMCSTLADFRVLWESRVDYASPNQLLIGVRIASAIAVTGFHKFHQPLLVLSELVKVIRFHLEVKHPNLPRLSFRGGATRIGLVDKFVEILLKDHTWVPKLHNWSDFCPK